MEDKIDIIEELAALEHEQWSHWMRHMINNLTKENIDRWSALIDTPYSDLTEEQKKSDRYWAIQSLVIIRVKDAHDMLKLPERNRLGN